MKSSQTLVLLVGLCVCSLIFLPSTCSAQIASPSKLLTVGGFMDVCGSGDRLSKEQFVTMRNVAPAEFQEKFEEALADRTAETSMCLGFVLGLEQGWKEGHEHGVVAAQFPDGWPRDERKALAAFLSRSLHGVNGDALHWREVDYDSLVATSPAQNAVIA